MEKKTLKVLICDDSILIRKKLKDCLLEFGCSEIIEALDGQSAIDLYKQHKPNLVFMDIEMRVKTAIEVLKEIVEFDENAKIVMLTSSITKKQLKDDLRVGAHDFIQKPFKESTIEDIILNLQEEIN